MGNWVYNFGGGKADGSAELRDLLGGKGANLAEMANLGLPVPPGFTITTEVCTAYYENDQKYPDALPTEVADGMQNIEAIVSSKFGDPNDPLLVSVRSGGRASMPGMMDTVLNLGLNDETVEGMAYRSNDGRFALDSYRRFIQMYADVVLGVDHGNFEDLLEAHKNRKGYMLDVDLTEEDWRIVVAAFKAKVEEHLGFPFPQDVQEQLWGAVGAVFGSWMNRRAITYRRLHNIPDDWGTAVNVQAMVFGNMGDDCATGVAFTRDPSTGVNRLYGEFLPNAQGEDVVAGIRTPQHLTIAAREVNGSDLPAMEEAMPEVFRQLSDVFENLETHYRDMQDIEFTVQQNKLWILQTRSGKRTARAALKIAVDMAEEGLITEHEALTRIDPMSLDQLLHPTLDPSAERDVLAKGLPASPGAASGMVVFTADDAEHLAGEGTKVILVRMETSPEDIHGMHAAQGILTSRGGMTSHAAVVARGMGRPCVSGAGALHIDYDEQKLSVGDRIVDRGEVLTIDGSSGEIMVGEAQMIQPELSGDFARVMAWADEVRRLRVRTNAETPLDSQTARDFGAEGIGLCRTEHMFFDADRIVAVREMIVADDERGRRAALSKILQMQRDDFAEIFHIMAGLPVTIRLLDPPLHEFLPHTEEEIADVAAAADVETIILRQRVNQLRESNPMLGHRGCRLGITYPEIYEMQARAIFEAALDVGAELETTVEPEIMLPLVATRKEFDILRDHINGVADQLEEERGQRPAYLLGTMIELPRAALRASEIAEGAEFFSFGTNDLTQTTFGISRDDAASFLEDYVRHEIFPGDPFVSLDVDGVGELLKIASERGRKSRPDLKLGICGEHGGDPASVVFCHRIGLDYVSCSPYRVPIARLAAAQAALEDKSEG
jgi:pyruvate,orthophosphate dikinase